MSAGRLRNAEAASAALQTQLKQLQDSHEAQANQSSQAQEALVSQEDADGMSAALMQGLSPFSKSLSLQERSGIRLACKD